MALKTFFGFLLVFFRKGRGQERRDLDIFMQSHINFASNVMEENH